MSLLLFLTGCTVSDPPRVLDVDVPPVTEGEWYRPDPVVGWHWQLQGAVNVSYDVEIYDIDLFDTEPAQIASLQGQGRRVICYFSAGSREDWREDAEAFAPKDYGRRLGGWEGEHWLDIRSPNVHSIMAVRLDLAQDKGCDGVEPDNVDAWDNRSGFELTRDDQLAYNRFLANSARERGLSVALKNATELVEALVDYYDLSVNEQCQAYEECSTLAPFVAASKPVLNAEYPGDEQDALDQRASACAEADKQGLRTLLLPLDLDDSFRVACGE